MLYAEFNRSSFISIMLIVDPYRFGVRHKSCINPTVKDPPAPIILILISLTAKCASFFITLAMRSMSYSSCTVSYIEKGSPDILFHKK